MATIALAAAGGALFPAATTGVFAGIGFGVLGGSLMGGIIDQYLLFPAIFPPDDVEGPKIDDQGVTTASEGTPIPKAYGPSCRIPGSVIWLGPLITETVTESAGKGGVIGGGPQVNSFEYYRNVAVLISEGEDKLFSESAAIDQVSKVIANNRLIYKPDENLSVGASALLSAQDDVAYHWDNGSWVVSYNLLRIESTAVGPDLTVFHGGVDATVAGFSNSVNNGTRLVRRTARLASGGTALLLIDTADTTVDEAAGASVTITQTVPGKDLSAFDDITVYLGDHTQNPDPTIEAEEGVGNVSAYRGYAYVVFDRLFGHHLPNFQFMIRAEVTTALSSVVSEIMDRAGIASTKYDVTGLTSTFINGYWTSGTLRMAEALAPLMIAYDLNVKDENGTMVFYIRGEEDSVTIPSTDLSAHSAGSETPEPLLVEDRDDFTLPRYLIVEHLDTSTDNQRTAWSVLLETETNTNETQRVVLTNLLLSNLEGQRTARRIAWRINAERFTGKLELPPKYVDLTEGDEIRVTDINGEVFDIIITAIDRGDNYIHRINGIITDSLALTIDNGADEDGGGWDDDPIYVPPELTFLALDCGALRSSDATTPGWYYALCASDRDAQWAGGTLFYSLDGGTTYDRSIPVVAEAKIGEAVTQLADGPIGYWDRINTVQVEMLHSTLSSATESAVLAGANRIFIGGELIAFQTATLVTGTTATYELATLLRGMRDTADTTTLHQIGDLCVLLEEAPIFGFKEMNTGNIGKQHTFKAVPIGGDIADFEPRTQTMTGRTVKCFAPGQFSAARNTSGDLVLDWVRRTRDVSKIFNGSEVPMLPSAEIYEIDIYDGIGYTTVLRTITVTDATTGTYTEAQQTTDGFTPNVSTIYGRMYQVDPAFGRGNKKEFSA